MAISSKVKDVYNLWLTSSTLEWKAQNLNICKPDTWQSSIMNQWERMDSSISGTSTLHITSWDNCTWTIKNKKVEIRSLSYTKANIDFWIEVLKLSFTFYQCLMTLGWRISNKVANHQGKGWYISILKLKASVWQHSQASQLTLSLTKNHFVYKIYVECL